MTDVRNWWVQTEQVEQEDKMSANSRLARIERALALGHEVHMYTYTKTTVITQKCYDSWQESGRPLFKIVGDSLFIGRGRHYDCVDGVPLSTDRN